MAPTVPFYTRIIMSSVQSVLTACLIGIYFQSVIPIPGFTIPAWNLWILSVPAWTLWVPFDLNFQTTCLTPTQMQGLNPFSVDDSIYICALPWSYQTLIVGGFIAAFGNMINDTAYRWFKKTEVDILTHTSGSPVDETVTNTLLTAEEQANNWHSNVQASMETMALASNTGLIAALSAPDWGVEGVVIDNMRLIVQVTIMANYLIQGVVAIAPLLSLLLLIWTYIFDLEQIWGWSVFIWNWTFGLAWWWVTWIWERLCCIKYIATCQFCASDASKGYETVPHDNL